MALHRKLSFFGQLFTLWIFFLKQWKCWDYRHRLFCPTLPEIIQHGSQEDIKHIYPSLLSLILIIVTLALCEGYIYCIFQICHSLLPKVFQNLKSYLFQLILKLDYWTSFLIVYFCHYFFLKGLPGIIWWA